MVQMYLGIIIHYFYIYYLYCKYSCNEDICDSQRLIIIIICFLMFRILAYNRHVNVYVYVYVFDIIKYIININNNKSQIRILIFYE